MDTGISFRDPKLVKVMSFEMNWQQTYRSHGFMSVPAKRTLPYFNSALSVSHLAYLCMQGHFMLELEGGDGIVVYEHTSHSSNIKKKTLEYYVARGFLFLVELKQTNLDNVTPSVSPKKSDTNKV